MSIELELPLFSLDEVLVDNGTADLILINRSPSPDETDIQNNALIEFDLVGADGSAPSPAATLVYVQIGDAPEALAYDGPGSGFQAGYAGALSAVTAPYAAARHFVIQSTAGDYPSLAVITVRVVTTAPVAFEGSYSFTIEDLTAPVLLSARADTKNTVRVVFDESVIQGDGSASNDALNPANYAFTRLNIFPEPAVNVVAVSVVALSSQEVEITLDIEISPSRPYRLTVEGVADTDGNVIEPPFNAYDFTGFVPAAPAERDFRYYQMLSDQLRNEDVTRELEAIALCFQDVIDLLLCMVDGWTEILDVDTAPESFLDAMLCDLGNPFGFELSVTDKRRLIRVLLDIYKQKGTSPGIQNVIRFFLGLEVDVVAFNADEDTWILGVDELGEGTTLGPGSQYNLYAFEILVSTAISFETEQRIEELVEYMKPAHTHLVRIVSPETPAIVDHLELGLSLLGETWILH